MDENSLNSSNVKVAVRVRPMNRREKDLKTKCVVEMEGNQTVLYSPVTNANKGDPRDSLELHDFASYLRNVLASPRVDRT